MTGKNLSGDELCDCRIFGIGMINGLNMDERTADYSERIIYEEIAGFGAGEE